jgi:hypothetical protein
MLANGDYRIQEVTAFLTRLLQNAQVKVDKDGGHQTALGYISQVFGNSLKKGTSRKHMIPVQDFQLQVKLTFSRPLPMKVGSVNSCYNLQDVQLNFSRALFLMNYEGTLSGPCNAALRLLGWCHNKCTRPFARRTAGLGFAQCIAGNAEAAGRESTEVATGERRDWRWL